MSGKVLCSIGSGPHEALLRLSRPTFEDYAERHGYALDVRTEALDTGRPAPWSKVRLLREKLDDFEQALWIDADALVLRPDLDLAAVVERDAFLALVAHRWSRQEVPNTGVMLFRAGERASAFLDALWSREDLIDHPWWDNAAALAVLGYRLPADMAPGLRGRAARLARARLGWTPPPVAATGSSRFRAGCRLLDHEWNSVFYDPSPQPRIRHFLGSPTVQRLADMTTVLDELKRERARP